MIRFTVYGEPASKANSRELATIGPKDDRRTILRKSDKALDYRRTTLPQIPPKARQRLDVPVRMTLWMFYASERPDLDESQLLDLLQDQWRRDKRTGERVLVQAGVYRNDRQVRERHVYHAIDRKHPRVEIEIEPMVPAQAALELPGPDPLAA